MTAGRRDYTIFQVGKATLLRVSDVMTLKKSDVYNPDGSVKHTAFIHDKKTGKANTLYLKPVQQDLLQYHDWLVQQNINSDWLFPSTSRPDRPITEKQFYKIMARVVVKLVRKYAEKHTDSNPWKYYESTMESIIANHVENMTDLENYNYRLTGKLHKPVQQQLPLLSVVNNNEKQNKYKTRYYRGKRVEQGTDWSKKKAKTYTDEELDAQARNSLHMKPDEPFTGKWANMTPAERSAEALHECFVALEKGIDL